MIKNGITTFTDTSTYPEVILKKVIKSGVRANIGLPILSCKTKWAEKEQEYFKKSISFYDEYRNNPSIKLYLNLNAIHMLSKSGFEKVSQIASELDIPIRMYLHENLEKLNMFKKKNKQRPIKFLEDWLQEITNPMILDKEIEEHWKFSALDLKEHKIDAAESAIRILKGTEYTEGARKEFIELQNRYDSHRNFTCWRVVHRNHSPLCG